MSLPYFPMYPTDFEAKTSHLTLEEDGAYNRLMRLCWMTPGCSLPDDNAWIMRRMRVDKATFEAVVLVIIGEFFTRENGRVFSDRLRREAMLAEEAHAKRVAAGRKGGQKPKSLKNNKTGVSNAKAKPKQPEPEPELIKRDTKVSPKKPRKTGTRLPEDWVLPKHYGEWAIGEGWSEDSIRLESDKFKDFWIAKSGRDAAKLDWLATWRNWLRNSKTPKFSAIEGGQNHATSKTDRLRRVVTTAAAGTSGKDWG